jgi:outer membrane protein TolC
MKLPINLIKCLVLTAAAAGSLLLASCTSSLFCRPPSLGNAVGALGSALTEPFRSIDHDRFTRATAAMTLANDRAKPATVALGKKHLTLEDCRGMALSNNLELQASRMDEITKQAIEYSNRTKVLPHFMFTGDLGERDNQSYAFSDVLGQEGLVPNPGASGTGVTNYSVGHERSTWRYVLEARWSPTDACLAYYVSMSSNNEKLKAHYHKVRVAQKLIAVVDSAYFRLLGLQEAVPAVTQLVEARTKVAENTKQLFARKIATIEDTNRANQQQVRAQRILSKIRIEIAKQRNILASAMGLSPDYCVDGGFCVIGKLPVPDWCPQVCDLEMQAVQNRPEAFEAGLNHINSVYDLRRTIVKYMPKVSGFWRYTRDKDHYLYNKDWKEVGLAVYFDILDWISNTGESKAAASNQAKTYKEMGSVAVAISSQVRIAALQYFDAMEELRSTQSAARSSQDVVKTAELRVSRDDLDRLGLEEARANNLQDKIERTRALGEVNAGLAELYGAVGSNYSEPVPHH